MKTLGDEFTDLQTAIASTKVEIEATRQQWLAALQITQALQQEPYRLCGVW